MGKECTIRIQRVPEEKYSELKIIADELGFASIQELLRSEIDVIIENRTLRKIEGSNLGLERLEELINVGNVKNQQAIEKLTKLFTDFVEEEFYGND